MEINVAFIATSVFAYYMVVAGNFLPELFGCRLQRILRESMLAKHITGFLLLYFLVVVVNPSNADKRLLQNGVLALALYILFIVTTRTPFPVMIIILVLLLALYLMDIKKQRILKEENSQDETSKLDTIQQVVAIVILILSFVGFGMYLMEKKQEYKGNFSFSKFILGNVQCRNYTPTPI